jgi:ATP-binding cassette, subfamily D (ALD), peroxisomal long-chain fatty acid import protein
MESMYDIHQWLESITDPFIRIVASLVRAQPLQFFWNILRWLLVAIPATWTNSWLSYIQNKLAIAYRTRLTQEVMRQYLGGEGQKSEGKVYYKLGWFENSSPSFVLSFTKTSELGRQNKEPRPVSLLCIASIRLITCPRMITHDIQRFSNHLAAIYSNLAKPTLDVILYNYQLSKNVGAEGVMGLTIFVQLSAMLC